MSQLYNVKRGNRQIQLADKKSSTELIYTLMVMGCTENVSQSCINGCQEAGTIYQVGFADRSVNVIGINDAVQVLRWMLEFGSSKCTIEKVGDYNSDN